MKITIQPTGDAEILDEYRFRLNGDVDSTVVEVFAWADFDHDQIEDVLLFIRTQGPQYYWAYHRGVTRLEAEGALRAIEVDPYAGLRP